MKTSEIPPFWDTNGHQIPIAHRGGDAVGGDKENSLAAFEAADRLGYKYFETDVVPTKEGKLLAIHGRGFQRHPNPDLPTRRRIQHMTLAEIKKEVKVGGFAPVLLEELLASFPDAYWFIDPKVATAVKPLANLLKQGAIDLDHVSVGAFKQERTSGVADEVYEATGRDVCTSIGPIGAFAILGASDTPRENLELRDRKILSLLQASHRLPDPRHIVEATGATSLNIPYRWLTPGVT